MKLIMIDIESDGPVPGDFSMVAFGAVFVQTGLKERFSAKLKPVSSNFQKEALDVCGLTRIETLGFDEPAKVMRDFDRWLKEVAGNNPSFISDNNGFDWMFMTWYFHRFIGKNPFGHTSLNLGSFYKGLTRDFSLTLKDFRRTPHTRDPLDDALGNSEALLDLIKIYNVNQIKHVPGTLYDRALEFAREKHKEQKRKMSNDPYIIHPIRVAEIVRCYGGNEDQIAAALLHDTVEDTDTKPEEIEKEFGSIISGLVAELTNDDVEKERMGKEKYLTKKISSMSPEALLVKFADRLDNVRDIGSTDSDWSIRYNKQTNYILDNIQNPNLNNVHQQLVREIGKITRP